jgi:hypothetical protein
MPGWKAFVEPLLGCIDPMLGPKPDNAPQETEILTLGAPKVLVTSMELANALKDLSTLLSSHPHPSLAKRLLRPILMPLWALSSWAAGDEKVEAEFVKPARHLLKTLIRLWPSSPGQISTSESGQSSSSLLNLVLRDLLFKGKLDAGQASWEYATGKAGTIQIQRSGSTAIQPHLDQDMKLIDTTADKFVGLMIELTQTPDFDTEVSQLFMGLCTKWLSDNKTSEKNSIITRLSTSEPDNDVTQQIVEAKVMQKMMSALPEKLVSDSRQVTYLVNQVLRDFLANRGGGIDFTQYSFDVDKLSSLSRKRHDQCYPVQS